MCCKTTQYCHHGNQTTRCESLSQLDSNPSAPCYMAYFVNKGTLCPLFLGGGHSCHVELVLLSPYSRLCRYVNKMVVYFIPSKLFLFMSSRLLLCLFCPIIAGRILQSSWASQRSWIFDMLSIMWLRITVCNPTLQQLAFSE
jgi:hypothetical protein